MNCTKCTNCTGLDKYIKTQESLRFTSDIKKRPLAQQN